MAVILSEQSLNFTLNSAFGLYCWMTDVYFALFEIAEGETYKIVWDGTEYTCTAETMTLGTLNGIGLGNKGIAGLGNDSGEPFIFAYMPEYNQNACFSKDTEETAHTVAINLFKKGIVLKDHAGNDIVYEGVKNIKIPTSDGGVQSFTMGEAVIKEVELAMDNGDQILEPEEGKLFDKVTVKKPSTLVPSNIAKGINIGGVVGNYAGGSNLYNTTDPEWLDKVVFWDYDGTIVSMITIEEAKALSELPTPPTHEGLTFQGWNFTLEEIHATTDVLDIGAIYVPSDGKTHVIIELTSTSYLEVPTYFSQTVSNGVTIDWGDGTVETISGTGVVSKKHTYASIGEYEVTYEVADGCEMTMGGNSSSYRFIWKDSANAKVKEIYVGNGVVEIGTYAFYNYTAQYIELLTISNGVNKIGDYAFGSAYNLHCALLPNTIEMLGGYFFKQSGYYTDKYSVISIPNSITSFGTYIFQYSNVLRVVIPNSVESLANYMFESAYALQKVVLSNNIKSLGGYCFRNCRNLKKVKLPSELTQIPNYCFTECGIEKLEIPYGVTTIGDYAFRYAYSLCEVILPSSLVSLGKYCFENCRSLRRLVIPENVETLNSSSLTYCTALQSIIVKGNKITTTSSFSNLNQSLREVVFLQNEPPSTANSLSDIYHGIIYAPDEAVEAYKAVITNSPEKFKIKQLSEYIGEMYWL